MTQRTPDAAHFRSLVQGVVRERPWLTAWDVLVAAAAEAEQLLELGASRVLAIGAYRGVGELPDPERVPTLELGIEARDLMSTIRASQRAFAAVDDDVRAAIDRFDPEGEACAMAAPYSDGRPVGGRRVFGARPASWQRLEDKTRHEELWDAAGVPQAPACVVPVELSAVQRAARELGGEDVVLAGDSREGFNGGASCVRWVRDEESVRAALAELEPWCDHVRVMPFLQGLPCSIHGIVFADEVVTLRPFEMVVFQAPDVPRLVYAGSACTWDPPAHLLAEMRDVAQRVGRELQRSVGYRGVFTVDGVATPEGFRPTELNPRFGAALLAAVRPWKELPLFLLHTAIAEGLELDWRPRELERLVRDYIEQHRQARATVILGHPVVEAQGKLRREAPGVWRSIEADEPWDAWFALGPVPAGGVLRLGLDPERLPRGAAAAPRILEVLRHLDAEHGLRLDRLEAAATPA